METRTDITALTEEQLRELVGKLYAKLEQTERKMGKLKQMLGDMADSASDREMECEDRFQERENALKRELTAARTEAEAWKEKFHQMERRALIAEARLEEKEHAQPMTIIYGNHATSMYGNNIGEQDNSTNNHKSKNEMNNPTINNYGGNNLVGDGNTMNVYEAQETQTAALTPSQEQMESALMRLAAGELAVGKIADTCWWGVHKFLTEYRLTDMNMAEFGVYLVNHRIQEKNIYDNFRRTGSTLTMLARLRVADWGSMDGSTTEAAQRQIDVVKCLHKELCGK